MSSSGSVEIFSFPRTPNQDSDFEFGSFTPDSPSQDPSKNSPADHLFLNGRLLPHPFFPSQQQINYSSIVVIDNVSRPPSTSRASSIRSREYSLMSSRSNSSSSSRSSCSSGRTSYSSDNSERRLLYGNNKDAHYKINAYNNSRSTTKASKIVTAQLYRNSQRWQHITPVAAAALKRDVSGRKSNGVVLKEGLSMRSKRKGKDSGESENTKKKKKKVGMCWRIFMSFWLACRECHAIKPSRSDDVLP